MKSTSLWECPSGSRKQRSPALSTSIYKASAATCQGSPLANCAAWPPLGATSLVSSCTSLITVPTNMLCRSTSGAAVLLCLTDDGLLSVLTAGNLEVISQEKVVQKADRT